MNHHEGVSCDSCLKSNFRGRRYKCLRCYDYDLCSVCHEAGATNTRHSADHPMQCMLTRSDFELYYGGETLANDDQPQSYTCPYCGRMGFTEATLHEHVITDHVDTAFEVVCPVCAGMPGGDPNFMTDDFAGHLTLEHRTGPRDLISFLDEPVATRVHSVRRIPHSGHLGGGSRTSQSGRPRRSNMHFSTGALSSLSPSSRDSVDPIAELLSQLSGVRRSASNTSNSSTPSQLQQLQMQLQLERHQVNIGRHQMERIPRRQVHSSQTASRDNITNSDSNNSHPLMLKPSVNVAQSSATSTPTVASNFLLPAYLEELSIQDTSDELRLDRSQFVTQLLLSTLLRPADQTGEEKKESSTPLRPDEKKVEEKNKLSTPLRPDQQNGEEKKELSTPLPPEEQNGEDKKELSTPLHPDEQKGEEKKVKELSTPSRPHEQNGEEKED